jgi:hypothetical protein
MNTALWTPMRSVMHSVRRPVMCAAAIACSAPAHAEWFGEVALTSNQIERGVSQSERKPSLSVLLGAKHASSGLYAQLGAARPP